MNRTNKRSEKPKNPVNSANFISKWSFWWVKDIFVKGVQRPLEESEIYDIRPSLDSELLTNEMAILWEAEQKRDNPSFLRMLFRAYGWSFIPIGLLFSLSESVTRICQPLFLGGIVAYFAEGQTEISKDLAYLYGAGIVLCSLLPVLTFHPFIFHIFQIGTKIRVSCSGLIYRKILQLSKLSVTDGLSGRAITILSNDLGKFDAALAFFHDLWKGPVDAILLGYFMYREIGVSAVIGVAFMLSFIPLQAWAAKKAAHYRQRTAERTDYRVKLMNEIIQGIQVIKMYAWEKSFASIIHKIRRKELNAVRGSLYIHAALHTTAMISKIAIFLSLVSYVFLGVDAVTAKKIFIVSSFFNVLNDSMVYFWPLSITFCAEAYVSTRRIKEFLLETGNSESYLALSRLYDRTNDTPNGKMNDQWNQEEKAKKNGVKDANVNGDYCSSSVANPKVVNEKEVIRRFVNEESSDRGVIFENASASWDKDEENDNVAIGNCNLTIKGPLSAVVGPVGCGKSTILNVILGELPLNSGTVTVNGILSYAGQEPWLFESSIQDNIVFIEDFDENLYKEVVHVCALERDFELFPHGDSTIVGERGISLSGGQKARINLARAIYKKADIYLLDDPLSAVDSHVGRHIFEKCIKGFLKNKICILVTHQLQYLKDIEHVILMNSGYVEFQGNYKTLQNCKQFSFLSETHDEAGGDENLPEKEIIKDIKMKNGQKDMGEDRKEVQAVGSVKLSVYKSYFKSLGNYSIFFLVLTLFITARILLTGVEYFLSRWAIWEENVAVAGNFSETNITMSSKEQLFPSIFVGNSEDITVQRENILITYTVFLGITFLLYLARTFGFYIMCLRISLKLHDQLFHGITRATMYFFNTNPSGRILNRFSKDINTIDEVLPDALIDCLSFFTDITAVLAIVIIANYYLLLPAVIVTCLFYILRTIFVNTSRSVKRIESMARSPIYSHTNQTFQGLTTIRALKAQNVLEKEFHNHLNNNTASWFIFLAITRAFALWLDFVCVAYIAAVTFSFLVFDDKFYSGDVGLAIMNCITMIGMCQWGMRQTAELENQMTGVERIIEYANAPSEPALETAPENKPVKEWPSKGKIDFEDLSLRYSEKGENVLNHLNFTINPNEKVGIVGRTGAGKSSMIQSIFRLAINEGLIKIDDFDIDKLGLHDLRSKISIIPQDPVLFSGTLRFNLDPFDTKRDSEIWNVLEEVELKGHVSALTGGLYCKMFDGGSNFSVGQRQLVCLARAILRDNKILILDEATANVDSETDKLIQETIRGKFSDCTVLTIAHRLHTVMDSDKILVFDAGRCVEMGAPYELLQKSDGFLSKLVSQTTSSSILLEIAKRAYKEDKDVNRKKDV